MADKYILSLVGIVLITTVINSASATLHQFDEEYHNVNQFLSKYAKKQHDAQLYLDKVLEKKQQLETSTGCSRLSCTDFDLKVAIDRVSKLSEVWNEPICDSETQYWILKSFSSNKGYAFYENPEEQLLKPLDYLVHKVWLSHAEKCIQEYPKIFEKVYANLKPEIKELAEGFIKDELIKGGYNLKFLPQNSVVNSKPMVKAAVEHIRSHAKADNKLPPAKYLYQEYLLFPCQIYYSTLGPKVLYPAIADSKLLSVENVFVSINENENENLSNFYRAIAHTKICAHLDHNFRFSQAVIKELELSGMK